MARPDYYENLAADALMLAATKMASTTNTAATATKVATEAVKEGTQALKPLGLGSTGRTAAANLTEQLAMKEVMSNPTAGKILNLKKGMADPRWPQSEGWEKMQYIHTDTNGSKTVIHYVGKWEDENLKFVDDFKFE